MKYLLFFIALFTTLSAHSQCSEFDNLLKKGDNYLKGSKPNYQEAINAYTAAILACSDRAGEAKQRITRMVNEINKLREKATEAQRNAEMALANLEKANADVVKLILENADRDILNLRYEDALQKIKAAAGLGALKPEVAKAYLEIAFWHGETGNIRRAAALLDSIADFTKNIAVSNLLQQIPADTTTGRNRLREVIKAVDDNHFTFLFEQKYYPDMVAVQGGKFMMGCDNTIDPNCEYDETLHEQELSNFHIARTETTVWQFALFCTAQGQDINEFLVSTWSDLGDNPIGNVSWFDAVEYSNWVNRQKGGKQAITKDKVGKHTENLRSGYRLPTEAEWEYAAKGGKKTSRMTVYSGSNDLDSVGWYNNNSGGRTHSVRKKKANALGLYDMSGNVWELCWDCYGKYNLNPEKDYAGPKGDSNHVIRGGSWDLHAEICRTAARLQNRTSIDDVYRLTDCGFRLVFVP